MPLRVTAGHRLDVDSAADFNLYAEPAAEPRYRQRPCRLGQKLPSVSALRRQTIDPMPQAAHGAWVAPSRPCHRQ